MCIHDLAHSLQNFDDFSWSCNTTEFLQNFTDYLIRVHFNSSKFWSNSVEYLLQTGTYKQMEKMHSVASILVLLKSTSLARKCIFFDFSHKTRQFHNKSLEMSRLHPWKVPSWCKIPKSGKIAKMWQLSIKIHLNNSQYVCLWLLYLWHQLINRQGFYLSVKWFIYESYILLVWGYSNKVMVGRHMLGRWCNNVIWCKKQSSS